MSYQVLARKWRPKTFAELVGQEHVVRALSNALVQQRLHHAYLLTGTRGVGKTTLARILAKSLNCETGITAEPCGQCSTCREIDMGRYVDLLELDAASNTGVDNMREVLDNAQYAPTAGRFKVYLIDEVHMLSKGAFNSMLKTLEEPPAHVKFILATTDPQKIPVTVLSRCLQFNLKHLPPKEIEGQLNKVLGQEGVPFDVPAVALIARAAQGSMRDALSLLDQAIAYGSGKVEESQVRDMLGAIDQGYLFALLNSLARHDGPAMIRTADDMQERALSFDAALQDLGTLLHRIALSQTVPEAIAEDEPERASLMALARAFSPDEVQLYYQIALQCRRDLYLAPDEYAGFTMALMRMLAFAPQQASGFGSQEAGKTAGSTPPPAPPRTPVAQPAVTRQETRETKRAEPETRDSQPASPNTVNAPDWPALVERLCLGGMARMLAQHCELKGRTDDEWQLTVPAAHKHLADKPYQDKLATALSEHFNSPQKITLKVGSGNGMTPVEVGERRRHELQAGAVAAIEQDPLVREIIETFDARIIENSIRPIQ